MPDVSKKSARCSFSKKDLFRGKNKNKQTKQAVGAATASPVQVSARRKMEEVHSRAEEEVKDRASHHVELGPDPRAVPAGFSRQRGCESPSRSSASVRGSVLSADTGHHLGFLSPDTLMPLFNVTLCRVSAGGRWKAVAPVPERRGQRREGREALGLAEHERPGGKSENPGPKGVLGRVEPP